MPQKKYVSHYEHLKNKWTEREGNLRSKLLDTHASALDWLKKHATHTAAGSATTLLLFARSGSLPPTPSPLPIVHTQVGPQVAPQAFLISDLYNKLPQQVQPLTPEQKERVSAILSTRFGLSVRTELEGVELNTNYGLIGEEQHLSRYPGDSMNSHFSDNEEALRYWSSGMAPGLGAWGHFANSQSELTQKDIDREKYYIAVQTWLSEGYNENVAKYNAFYKYRKVLVVNPQNGKALVADIADAGPSPWTGKQLGGSPEVMAYLERQDGAQKGPVLYFFIDDPQDTIPLGPREIK